MKEHRRLAAGFGALLAARVDDIFPTIAACIWGIVASTMVKRPGPWAEIEMADRISAQTKVARGMRRILRLTDQSWKSLSNMHAISSAPRYADLCAAKSSPA